MVYRLWEWYDSLRKDREMLRFFICLIIAAPFIFAASLSGHSSVVLVCLVWVCLVIVSRIYYLVRKEMDEETRAEAERNE